MPAVVCRGGMAGVSLHNALCCKARRLANGPRTRENFLPTQKRLLQRVACGGKLTGSDPLREFVGWTGLLRARILVRGREGGYIDSLYTFN